jgi:hypothetical protein
VHLNHKYTEKYPDGHGGFTYIYDEKGNPAHTTPVSASGGNKKSPATMSSTTKQANFDFAYDAGGGRIQKVHGSVKLKDGKISVSIPYPKHYSYAAKYAAKQFAIKAANDGFVHPSLYGVKESSGGLSGRLETETAEHRVVYMAETRRLAKEYYEKVMTHVGWTREQWLAEYGVDSQVKGSYTSGSGWSYKTVKILPGYAVQMSNDLKAFSGPNGYQNYEDDEIADAEKHYNDSIQKLAYRLDELGVKSIEKVERTNLGYNLNMVIHHDGGKTKRAWTIRAEGPIQRLHLRYLIK